ncbi:hypothetical protein [Kribbella pratensis]|jgi:hypothetical protein|uniref:VapC45 PIN like domain-containing protein n=1 Tax=Kribbella pratensis TaxID=2512112 RepID=A0A4R8C4K1_9ACTN|nr:hypothetical protein [Kribbella pratensis]TDW70484.1 hypothetical protein EV653_4529 [Kribbella pratensis]
MRESVVRYYLDADILGLAKVLCPLRNDMTCPGDPGAVVHKRERPPCPIVDTRTPDTAWLPVAAAQGWLVISRDRNIRENLAERRAVRESGVKMIALAGDDARTKWGQLEVVMTRWRQIEALADEPGPFIYRAGRRRMIRLELGD